MLLGIMIWTPCITCKENSIITLQSVLYYPRYLVELNFGLKTADDRGANNKDLTVFHITISWAY